MEEYSNGDVTQDSEVVDDEPTVPVSLPDDTHDVSGKASILDTEKRRRLEEEDEDDKSGDRHRRKKKKVIRKCLLSYPLVEHLLLIALKN